MASRARALALGGIALVLLLCAVGAGAAASRPYLDIRVFTKVGQPGQPEPIAIGPDRRVYVGTNQLGHGGADAPSRIFAYSFRGRLLRQYVLKGQPLSENHGIQGLAFDGHGLLYALDRSANPRVVRINTKTGRQRVYSRFRDVPPCNGPTSGNCSQTIRDLPAGPDYAAFGPGGNLYVTDIDQALIWKVPRGGGRPSIWLTDPRFESLYGPNGIQFKRDGRTMLFVNTASNPGAGNSLTGRIYRVRIGRGGRPVHLREVWESNVLDAPDGLAIARSGRIYVALAGMSQVLVLSPRFEEIARVPPSPAANEAEEIPLDGPGSVAFLGRRLLVSNHSPIRGDPASWAILDVWAGERGLPLFKPRIRRRRG